jgi:dipicolinate synthase subunit A
MDKSVSFHCRTSVFFFFSITKTPHKCKRPYIICHERVIVMTNPVYYSAGTTKALEYAVYTLRRMGCRFSAAPDDAVTHLLLDVPFKNQDTLPELLSQLPPSVTVIGGNLQHAGFRGYQTVDLLQDPLYLAENASITAHCAIKLALDQLPVILKGCPVLVIGWGRIGKCLARLLKQMGAHVTVAARKETDLSMLEALGYDAVNVNALEQGSDRFRVIFNTVPVLLLSENTLANYRADCLKLELASLPGMAGTDIINARGLPNRGAPESSGELIARSILRLG